MTDPRIHPAYCRCPQCAPRHPAAHEIAPSLRAAIIAVLALGCWAGVFALAGVIASLLSDLTAR